MLALALEDWKESLLNTFPGEMVFHQRVFPVPASWYQHGFLKLPDYCLPFRSVNQCCEATS